MTIINFILKTVASWINKKDLTNVSMLKKSKITLVGKNTCWILPRGVICYVLVNYLTEIVSFY